MKLKEFGRPGGGVRSSRPPPLDPPLILFLTKVLAFALQLLWFKNAMILDIIDSHALGGMVKQRLYLESAHQSWSFWYMAHLCITRGSGKIDWN